MIFWQLTKRICLFNKIYANVVLNIELLISRCCSRYRHNEKVTREKYSCN